MKTNEISIVMNSVGRGGAEKSILSVVDYFVEKNINIKLILLFDDNDEYEISKNSKPHIVRLSANNWIISVYRLLKYLNKKKPSIVFSLMPQSNIASLISCLFCRLPFITSERTSPNSFYSNAVKLWLALLPHYFSRSSIFISNHAVNEGLPNGMLGQALKDRAEVLHNPIAQLISVESATRIRFEKLERIRNWLGTTPNTMKQPLKLLIVSRLVPGKGILEFIEAASGSLRTGAFQLTLAGDGVLAPNVNSMINKYGLQSCTHMAGFVTDMQQAFYEADIVVLPSLSEGFGRVGFEAYLTGCFVLGLPANSFCSEVTDEHPAWQTTDNFDNIVESIEAIGYSQIPSCGRDIRILADALSVKTHGDSLLRILGFSSLNEHSQIEVIK